MINDLDTEFVVEYQYDKFDIIDFLEPEYIDYLESIPSDIWKKFQSDITSSIGNINNIKLYNLIDKKIDINYVDVFTKKISKSDIGLLKMIIDNPVLRNKLITQLKSNSRTIYELYSNCILHKDIKFNKYFYEDVYLKYVKENVQINDKNQHGVITSVINFLSGNKPQPNKPLQETYMGPVKCDVFEDIFKKVMERIHKLPKYFEVFTYYIKKFFFAHNSKLKYEKYFGGLYANLLMEYKFDSIDKFNDIINALEMSDKLIIDFVFGNEKNDTYVYNLSCVGNWKY